jgi:hypothetical protein
MTSQVELTYSAFVAGMDPAAAAARMHAVPLPQDVLDFYGVRVASDLPTSGNPATRTIVLLLGPERSALATASLAWTASGSPVLSVHIDDPGLGYVLPPIVTFEGGRANPPPVGYGLSIAANAVNQPAAGTAYLEVELVNIVNGGSRYSQDTVIQVEGMTREGGVLPILTPNIDPMTGTIFGVTLEEVSPPGPRGPLSGFGLTQMPKITVVDPNGAGSGAIITVTLGVGEVQVLRPGRGYSTAPTVAFTDYFQAMFPAYEPTEILTVEDAAELTAENQSLPFRNLFTSILEQALMSPVTAADPVVS